MKTERQSVEGRPGRFVGVTEAGRALNLSISTVKRMAVQGQLDYFRTPGGHFRIFIPDDGAVGAPVRPPEFFRKGRSSVQRPDTYVHPLADLDAQY